MKLRKFFLLCFLLYIFIPKHVYAAGIISLNANKSELKVGDDIKVCASLPNDGKIYALTATFAFDTEVFAKIDDTSFIKNDETVSIKYNSKNNKFGIINQTGNGNELFCIKLKVKENAKVGTTNIGLTNISVSDGLNKKTYPKTVVKVFVSRDAKDGEEVPIIHENEINDIQESVIKVFTNVPIMIALSSILVLLFIFIGYLIKKHSSKKFIGGISFIALLVLGTIITLYIINNNKKDVNNDHIKDYNDAEEIIKYLIDVYDYDTDDNSAEKESNKNDLNDNNKANGTNVNIKQPSSNHNANSSTDFDVNNDGKVDINDAGSSTQDITENTNYKVTLKENDESIVYFEKGKITLQIKATIKPIKAKIKKIKVDDKYYDALFNNGIYEIEIDSFENSGVHEFKITSVILDNDREIKSKLTIKKEILKDLPFVNNVNLDEENNNLNFEIVDNDNAFIEGTVFIYNSEHEELLKQKVKSKNTINYQFKQDEIYTVMVLATYDRDTNALNDVTGSQDNLYKDEDIFDHKFMVGGSYNFQLTDLNITDALEKGDYPRITFTSSNSRNFIVEKVMIDNKEYNVSLVGKDKYELVLTNYDTTKIGKHQLNFQSVTLDNLRKFTSGEDYKANPLTFYVLKNKPKVNNITLTDDKDASNIKVSYSLIDKDKTLTKLNAIMYDSTGKEVANEEIDINNPTKTIVLSYKDNIDGLYNVKFIADYNLGPDQYSYTNKNIGDGQIITQQDIYFKNVEVRTKYPTKGQKQYEIIYDLYVGDSIIQYATEKYNKNRVYNKVSLITVNGLNYSVSQEKGWEKFKQKITLTIPNEAGIFELKATRVELQFEDYNNNIRDFYSVKPATIKVDILKDKPKIENLEITNEDYEKGQATFNFDLVVDNGAFDKGSLELNGEKQEFKAGKNSVTFTNITKDQTFNLLFRADYDLDSNILEEETNQNEYKDYLIEAIHYGLFKNDIYDSIALADVETSSIKGNKYYEKNEPIKINFNIIDIAEELGVEPSKIVIADKEYLLNKTYDGYQVILDGYSTFGPKILNITDVILNNGRKVTLNNPEKINLEILKDVVTITDYKYSVDEKNIKINLNLQDLDNSLVGNARIKILDEDGKVIKEYPYQNEIIIAKDPKIVRYYVNVYADYDRDIDAQENSLNYFKDINLLEKTVSLDQNNIELKDILDVYLYRGEIVDSIDKTETIETINLNDLKQNIDNYFVEVIMKNMPTIRSKIKNTIVENNHLYLILDYEYVAQENSQEKQYLKIDFGPFENNKATNTNHPETFADLINRLNNALDEKIILTHDYDASDYVSEDVTYINDFKGTLDGQGHIIKNLTKPLFNSINGGTAENLRLENVNLSLGTDQGSLANKVTNATIKNILVQNVSKTNSSIHQNGGLIGNASQNTLIENCKVGGLDLRIGDRQQSGGLIGALNNSTINNSYVTGTISASWNFIGGFVGAANNSTITNSYAKVNLGGAISCDFACTDNKTVLKNNLAITNGSKNGFANNTQNLENNYLVGNIQEKSGVKNITLEDVTSDLFTKNLAFSKDIWYIKDTNLNNLPILVTEKESKINKNEVGSDYDENKELLYDNLLKLMPFYDSKKIVNSARNIAEDNILNNKEIKHLVALDESGNIVTYLTKENPEKIKKLKIVFKTGEKVEYNVRYDRTYDMVASYRIKELQIDYNYNHYIIDDDSQIVNNLTNYLLSLNYEDNLDKLTVFPDSRIYKDFYNEVTKNELKEIVLKYLSNSNYTNTTNNEKINNYLEREIKKDQKLEKIVYVYNYFRRFYDLEINGLKLYDFILFNFQGFDQSLTPLQIADLLLSDGNNFNTNATNEKFVNVFGKYTNMDNIPQFLEYMVTKFSNQDMAKWIKSQFKGILVELPVQGHPEVQYTLWDHFSKLDVRKWNWYNYVLPILTLPENAGYIISTPGQFIIGSQRTYLQDPSNAEEHAKLLRKINSYAQRMVSYYGTAYKILNDAQVFNNIHTVQIDKRFAYEDGVLTFQNPNSTVDPFHKNFNEVINSWAYPDGNAATANGASIIWRAEGVLDGNLIPEDGKVYEYTYHTWSHETAHNMDARLFLRDYGRRFDAGGEDYADGNLTQSFGDGDIVMNLSQHYDTGTLVSANLDPTRIDSASKIEDFYKKLFQTLYILDYVEGQAFLKLEPEEQAKIAVQVSYPNDIPTYYDEKLQHLRYRSTKYSILTAEDFADMQLKSIKDLYENSLVIYHKRQWDQYNINHYGGENIYKVRWYQPHNIYGRPDSYSLKWLAYEMLGYAGYENGYIKYYSNIDSEPKEFYKYDDPNSSIETRNYKTDIMALEKITGYNNFEDYKMSRFNEVAKKLENINKAINVNKLFQDFYKALKADAAVERDASNRDFANSTEVRRQAYYAIKTATDDFLGLVYYPDKQQDVSEFKIPN